MIGTKVCHISVYDTDGDTITLTTVFVPVIACTVNAARKLSIYYRGSWFSFVFTQLNHISRAAFLWDIGKKCRARSDAA